MAETTSRALIDDVLIIMGQIVKYLDKNEARQERMEARQERIENAQERDRLERRSDRASQREIKETLESMRHDLSRVVSNTADTAGNTASTVEKLSEIRGFAHDLAISARKIQTQTEPKRPRMVLTACLATGAYFISTFTGVAVEVMGDHDVTRKPMSELIAAIAEAPGAFTNWLLAGYGGPLSLSFGVILGLHLSRRWARHLEARVRHEWLKKHTAVPLAPIEITPVPEPEPGMDSGQGVGFDYQCYDFPIDDATDEEEVEVAVASPLTDMFLEMLSRHSRRDIAMRLDL